MQIISGALAVLALSLADAATIGTLRGKNAPHLAGGASWGSDNKENGSLCAFDNECASGRCAANLRCDALLADGETCGEDPDCESGYCVRHGLLALQKLCTPASDRDPTDVYDNGHVCIADNACRSGRCAFGNAQNGELPTCADKLADGENCAENEDCASDLCEPHGIALPTCVGGNATAIAIH